MTKINILILLSAIIFISCDCNGDSDCNNVACTEEFVMITVNIVDGNQNPIILDDFKVVDIDNNIDLTDDLKDYYQSYLNDGTYPIFDDRFQQDYQNQEIELQFIGYIEDQEVINEYYLVGADCCHVYPISGNYYIIIE